MDIWILCKNPENKSNQRFAESVVHQNFSDIKLHFLNPEYFDLVLTKIGKKTIYVQGTLQEPPDVVVPRMGAGTTPFALATIRHLEDMGIPVINSAKSIAIAKDKLSTLQRLSQHAIAVPTTMLARFPINVDEIRKHFSYPLIVKTISGSHGKGVFICENKSKLEDLMGMLQSSMKQETMIILQEFIHKSKGKDIRVIVIGGKVIGAMLRTARRGTFKANVARGGKVAYFKVTSKLESLALRATEVIGLDIAGVDLLMEDDDYRVCEVNSSPGFEGFEEATGIDIPQQIFSYIRSRFTKP